MFLPNVYNFFKNILNFNIKIFSPFPIFLTFPPLVFKILRVLLKNSRTAANEDLVSELI